MLHEETKQLLAMAVTHLTTFIFYQFVEKSVRYDLQLFIDFFPPQPLILWTGISYNIDCFAQKFLHAFISGILTWGL